MFLQRLRNTTAERKGRQSASLGQTRQGYKLFVVIGGWKLLSRLSHKVCLLLSSAVLLRKFTSVLKATGRNIPDPLRTPPCLSFVVRKVRDKAARKLNRAGRSNEKDDEGGGEGKN